MMKFEDLIYSIVPYLYQNNQKEKIKKIIKKIEKPKFFDFFDVDGNDHYDFCEFLFFNIIVKSTNFNQLPDNFN